MSFQIIPTKILGKNTEQTDFIGSMNFKSNFTDIPSRRLDSVPFGPTTYQEMDLEKCILHKELFFVERW